MAGQGGVMDDRELIELAAKAAGFGRPYVWDHWPRQTKPTFIDDQNGIVSFDPLRDNSDAFVLASRLELTVDFNAGTVRNPRGELLAVSDIDIRLAITRAAAEIGKRVGAPQNAG
jgi:hypothetical protein